MNSMEDIRIEAENYMKEKGLDEIISEAFQRQSVKDTVRVYYNVYVYKCNELINRSKGNTDKLKKAMKEYPFETFLKDVHTTFIINQYGVIQYVNILTDDNDKAEDTIVENMKRAMKDYEEAALEDIEHISFRCLAELVSASEDLIEGDDTSRDMPKDIASFMKTPKNGICIIPFISGEDTKE